MQDVYVLISTKWTEGSIWIGSSPKAISDFALIDIMGQKVVKHIQFQREMLINKLLELELNREQELQKLNKLRECYEQYEQQIEQSLSTKGTNANEMSEPKQNRRY